MIAITDIVVAHLHQTIDMSTQIERELTFDLAIPHSIVVTTIIAKITFIVAILIIEFPIDISHQYVIRTSIVDLAEVIAHDINQAMT